jgi:hypothetical protein
MESDDDYKCGTGMPAPYNRKYLTIMIDEILPHPFSELLLFGKSPHCTISIKTGILKSIGEAVGKEERQVKTSILTRICGKCRHGGNSSRRNRSSEAEKIRGGC